jgi:hypothetical protein
MRVVFLFLCLVGALVWKFGLPSFGGGFGHLPLERVAPDEPIQSPLKIEMPPVSMGNYQIYPQARYDIKALVLAKKNYAMSEAGDIAPVDLALGWGAMSNPVPLKLLNISQSGRFYYYRWKNAPPIAPNEIVNSSANTHIIPANDTVKEALKRVKSGSIVHMKGYLVNVHGDNNYYWNSSMTRNDSGDGACELFYVESLNIE